MKRSFVYRVFSPKNELLNECRRESDARIFLTDYFETHKIGEQERKGYRVEAVPTFQLTEPGESKD